MHLGILDGPDGVHQPLKEKIQATKSKIPVCCFQQMGAVGSVLINFFILLSYTKVLKRKDLMIKHRRQKMFL
ncbi:MAG: hypothetical protein DRN00_02260 [Thermoplasmata archaeon]|nr:MAG: hypothetical protein DRN00_02260 [Thermoplasmata archaeon]